MNSIKLCACTAPLCEVFPLTATRLPLKGSESAHTIVYLGKCDDCAGLVAYPPTNFRIVLEQGTPEALQMLEAVIR